MSENEKIVNYFCLDVELDYPIYLRIEDQGISKDVLDMILNFGFKPIEKDKMTGPEPTTEENKVARFLDVSCASPEVRLQLSRIQESDLFGFESIIPQEGYNVYRYKEGGVLVFSNSANIWKLGCWTSFKDGNDLKKAYNIILNRFLSWAFVEHGVIGFWGRITGKEIELLKQKDSRGEAVYIDTKRGVAFGLKGELLPIQNVDIVIEKKEMTVDSTTKKCVVSKEKFISLLFGSCTYFDLRGLSTRVREMIAKIAKIQCAYIKPKSKEGSLRGLSL